MPPIAALNIPLSGKSTNESEGFDFFGRAFNFHLDKNEIKK